MTAPAATAPVPARRRYTGTVLIDVSAHVNRDGWLSEDGMARMHQALTAARGLRVRLEVGALRWPPARPYALTAALGCAAVEVSGTSPEGVAALVAWLHYHAPEG